MSREMTGESDKARVSPSDSLIIAREIVINDADAEASLRHKIETIPRVIVSDERGYKVEELRKGKLEGKKAVSGARISILYTGRLLHNNNIFADFTETAVELILGSGEILEAFEIGIHGIVGVEGMRVGDKRKITIPPYMGYDNRGCGELVPPNAWLVFEVQLVDVGDEIPLFEPISEPRPTNGFTFEVLVNCEPDGKMARSGLRVRALYTGRLLKNGVIFDDRFSKRPRKYRVGNGRMGLGFDFGIHGMRVGEKRKITVPPIYGFAHLGDGKLIPPHAWLVFEVQVIDAETVHDVKF